MRNNWPETVDELLAECKALEDRDLYTLGEKGEPYYGEDEPRVDGTDYLAGEYQYGVMMIPAQWVTHVISDATLGAGTCQADETETIECVCDDVWHYCKRLTVHVMECSECGHTYEHVNGSYEFCPRCGRRIVEVGE